MKPYYQDEWVTIYHGDCREILPGLPGNSVDLVLTDPPYTQDSIGIFGDIAKEAKRLLKDGCFLYAYCGAMFIPQVLPLMTKHLDWFWLHNIRHNSGYPSVWSKHIKQNSKPVLCFTNGKPIINEELRWVFSDFTKDKPDKKYHKAWGQGVNFPLEYIKLRTQPAELVLDPCVGGGSVPMAAKTLSRHCIGIEIKEKYCEIAANRCRQMVMELKC